jgi:protein Mpv17
MHGHAQSAGSQVTAFDAVRAARMGGFGATFYGPFQHYWYQHLERMLPTMSLQSFASKVCGGGPKGVHAAGHCIIPLHLWRC